MTFSLRQKIAAGIVLVALLFIAALVISLRASSGGDTNIPQTQASVSNPLLDANIQKLQSDIASHPNDPHLVDGYVALASYYVQKIRETADTSYYEKIDDLMAKAKAVDAKNPNIYMMESSAMLGRHHFKEGKNFIQQAISLDGNRPAYWGLLGDADIELGEYSDAVDAFQKMVDLRPDYNAYTRIAYIRELYGDIPGAKTALQTAITFGSEYPENIAWAYVELGKLNMRTSLATADTDFMRARSIVPNYAPALEGEGKVAFFQNNFAAAESNFLQAFSVSPLSQYATDLADFYQSRGESAKASQYAALAESAFAASKAAGVDTDLEESLFLSDHDLLPQDALAAAKRAYSDRPNEYAADYLSWALYTQGQYAQASKYTKEALRLGEFDPLILFHQGMIALKNNQPTEGKRLIAKALFVHPYFSLQYVAVGKQAIK